jgi:hypothetical protein
MPSTNISMPTIAKPLAPARTAERRSARALACAVGTIALAATAACNNYLSGPGKDQDPNNITALTDPAPLYLSVQTGQAVQFEGGLGRIAGMFTQQIAGPARQQIAIDLYQSQPTDVDAYFSGVYSAGGLVDVRKVQELAQARGDSTTAGLAKVYEALIMGVATSFWGDLPYSQAMIPNTPPAFDPQQQIYTEVQAKLDTAIVFLGKTGRSNTGPGQFDIVFGGSVTSLRSVYTAVAHTLKARFYMHLAERDASNYARARAEAQQGINDPAGDMNWFNSPASTSQNVFVQFQAQRGDLGPGAALVNLMKSRVASGTDTPDRLAAYFVDYCSAQGATPLPATDPNSYFGYRPGGDANLPGGAGSPPGSTCDGRSSTGSYSDFNILRSVPGFRSPVVTYAENQLILAEASYQVAGGGAAGMAAAQPFLDNVRQNEVYGADQNGPIRFPVQPHGLAAYPATLQNIMEEKYIDLFVNPEAWNDFKRTCLPYLAPAPGRPDDTVPGTQFVRRVPYGLNEFNTNPNTPKASDVTQFTPTFDDPNACPALNYTTSVPRAY